MPRYFFTTADGIREPDIDGTELPDVATARVEAIKFAGEVLSDHPEIIWDGEDFRVEVSDENGWCCSPLSRQSRTAHRLRPVKARTL
jgi:hypothetical protein